ncbi:MAG TPA: tetratricopeptide repeat protein, partial [Pirellulales bacterium]|nr:tetratricopeptide repeat protein [Pirellulales bacterium]
MGEVEILRAALAITAPSERLAFLERACGDDLDLRRRLNARLAVDDASRDRESDAEAPATAAGPTRNLPSSPSASQPHAPEKQIGPFKLLQQIGEGGMGVVYLAEQQVPIRRRVALKIIKPGMDSAEVVARFEAERQALALMDHHSIARVLDAGATDAGRPYFVMELVHGVPITRYCDENRLSPRERLEIFLPACQAIHHAHQKGVIHRDIKPSNVLVTHYDGRPTPKVIDFGVAKATEQRLTERTMFTQYGAVVGTPEYMSPEQAEMSALGVDTRSDIYSLGVLLYELLTGTTPLEHQRLREVGFAELMRLIKESEPPKPSTRLSSSERLPAIAAQRRTDPAALAKVLRGDLDWIVMKCLEKDRTRRYDSASELARDLERYLNDEPVDARPPSAGYRFAKFARKYKQAMAAAIAFAALVLTGASLSAWQAWRATSAEQAAREDRDRALVAERRANDERDKAQAAQQSEKDARSRAERAEAQAKADRDRALTAEHEAKQDRDRAVNAESSAQAAARQAQIEAATAQAVTDFLQRDLLSRANPSQEPNRDLKLRDVLDRTAQHIGGRFEKQPLVEASVRETIGKAYQTLGIYEEAARQFVAAKDLRRRESGENSTQVARDNVDLATAYAALGRPAEAEPLYLQALDVFRKTLGEDSPFTISTMAHLGWAYHEQGKSDEAQALYSKALPTARRVLDRSNPVLHLMISSLGGLLLERQQFAEAEPLLAEALDLHRRVLGAQHPDTITSMNNLALAYQGLGRWDEAEPLLTRALELRRRVQGDEHPLTITAMTSLALFNAARGKPGDAEPLLAKALELRRRVQGKEHPLT